MSDVIWVNKKKRRLNPKRLFFQALIPIVLIGSDIGIAYYFYYAGSTGMFNISNFWSFVTTMEAERILAVLLVAVVITILVEVSVRVSHLEN